MDKEYLLTYQDSKHAYGTFEWFDIEEELQDFVNNNDINVIEAFKINGVEKIDL